MKIGAEEIRCLRAFETISGVNPKDVIRGEKSITFLIRKKDMGQAIGKKGETIRKARERMGKNIELMEYSEDPELFIKKALYKLKFEDIEIRSGDRKTMELELDFENKKKLMNSLGKLKKLKEIAKREYGISDIKI